MTALDASAPAARSSVAPTLEEEALVALAAHRMLTVRQIHELLTPQAATTTNWSTRLNHLARAGLVRSLPQRSIRHPKVWCCTPDGLRIALPGSHRFPRPYLVPETGGGLVAHTLAVNDVGLAFLRAARQRGDDFDLLSWEHEVAHTIGAGRRPRHVLIADAVLAYARLTPDRPALHLRRFVELDRATEPVTKLAQQLHTYAAYRRWVPTRAEAYAVPPGTPAWRARYGRWPAICVVMGANPTKDREAIARRIDRLLDLCDDDPLIQAERLPVLVTPFDDLATRGPWAPIWRRLDAPDVPVDVLGRPTPTVDAVTGGGR